MPEDETDHAAPTGDTPDTATLLKRNPLQVLAIGAVLAGSAAAFASSARDAWAG